MHRKIACWLIVLASVLAMSCAGNTGGNGGVTGPTPVPPAPQPIAVKFDFFQRTPNSVRSPEKLQESVFLYVYNVNPRGEDTTPAGPDCLLRPVEAPDRFMCDQTYQLMSETNYTVMVFDHAHIKPGDNGPTGKVARDISVGGRMLTPYVGPSADSQGEIAKIRFDSNSQLSTWK